MKFRVKYKQGFWLAYFDGSDRSYIRSQNLGDLFGALAHFVGGVECCVCGKKNLSTVERDGGSECELNDGRWVCSLVCWDHAVGT